MPVEARKQTVTAPAAQVQGMNTEVEKAKKLTFSTLVKSNAVQDALMGTLGDAMHVKTFTASIISAVNTNRDLQNCDGMSIISAALLGESLKLSPSPQLGQYYLVPFKNTKLGITQATFQIGWKGYYQLALRSGQYRALEATPVKEGELIKHNPFTGECILEPLDDTVRDDAKTIGYYAFFELNNGFKKSMYWSKEKMEAHALKYSKGYAAKKGYTFWEKDFDGMACKTMFRQLIGKYGIMSIEMQEAFTNDMTVQPDITKANKPDAEEPIYFDAETGEVIDE